MGLAWANGFNAGVCIGYAATGQVGTFNITIKPSSTFYIAKIDRTMKYEHVLVDRYQYGVYQSSYYTTWVTDYRDSYYAVAA